MTLSTDAAGELAARSSAELAWPSLDDDGLLALLRERLAPRYEVIDVLGRGGMAVVFRANEPRYPRGVAIKVVRPVAGLTPDTARFLREIQLTAKLQHPNIVSLFDSGVESGLFYFVMPLVTGETLRTLLKREGRLPLAQALRLTRDIAGALEYAHALDIVHRDLKPENILLSSGRAMLADFGIASELRKIAGVESTTEAGVLIGTPLYMSPEQCNGVEKVDGRSDVYSLGCVLYEMLGGEPPFTGRNAQVIMARHASDRLPSIEVLRPDIPPQLVPVIEKALAKLPADRYDTAGAFERALDAAEKPDTRRRRLPAAIALVVAAATAIFYLTRPADAGLDRNRVAIFPLAERGLSVAESGSGAAVAVVINTALEHADPLRPLDLSDHLTPQQLTDPAAMAPGERRLLARSVGAAYLITGTLQAFADSVIVSLRLYDVAGDSLIAQRSAAGRAGVPLHRLGIEAVKLLLPALVDPGRTVDLTPLSDRRASAVALFIQGERAYRQSHFPAALQFYRRALQDDSSLVIAAIKGAQAAFWQDHHAARELAQFAARRSALLPPRYAAFARGLEASLAGRADSAELWLTRALAAAPGWPEAEMQLGDMYYHLVPLRGGLDTLAEQHFRLAAAADSGFTPPLIHLAEIDARAGRLNGARRSIARLESSEVRAIKHLQMMVDCVTRGADRYSWRLPVGAAPVEGLRAAKALAAGGAQLACAEGAFRAVLAVEEPDLNYGAVLGLQSLLAAQGRTRELSSLIDSVVAAGTLQVLMTSYLIDDAAGSPVAEQAQGVVRFGQSRWGPTYAGLSAAGGRSWLQWLFGVWHAKQGDAGTLASLRSSLERSGSRTADPISTRLAEALRGHERLLARDTAEAIRRFRALEPAVPSDSLSWSLALPHAVERMRLAELLLARGEYAAAISTASIFDHPEPMIYLAFLPSSLRIRAQAADSLGQRQQAESYRTRSRHLRPASEPIRSVRVPP